MMNGEATMKNVISRMSTAKGEASESDEMSTLSVVPALPSAFPESFLS